MKKSSLLTLFAMSALTMGTTSCHNGEVEFPDFDFSAAYFAYQSPVRTVVLGEDTYDTSFDNDQKIEIYATLAGMYNNENRVELAVKVDDTLCDNLYFDLECTEPVKPMPKEYYKLTSDKIVLDKVLSDGVVVELSDAFFADADAIRNTYVLPIRMTQASGVDSILSGRPKVDFESANLANPLDWDELPLNYTLYCVKFINPWHANYLRRGVDTIDNNGTETVLTRKADYIENDELISLVTSAQKSVDYTVSIPIVNEADGKTTTYPVELTLTFDESKYTNSKCTVSYAGSEAYTVSGTGEFIIDGDKNSWGNLDRDALKLSYEVDLGNGIKVATEDIMAVRNRGVSLETFTPTYK